MLKISIHADFKLGSFFYEKTPARIGNSGIHAA